MSAEDFDFGMEVARGIAVGSEVLAVAGEMELEMGLDELGMAHALDTFAKDVAEIAEGAEAIGASEILHAAADAIKEEDE
jgi:hypothetical protein